MQNNPFQPDVNYRGYTASPLLGTPQGLSVYMDGVRLNQPFGEVVSWDLIPRIAIASTTLMPGSNPLFGLNTLGGALSIQTKDGRTHPGPRCRRRTAATCVERWSSSTAASAASERFNWYLAGNLFAEDGWRDDSPSDVRQIFGKIGWQRDRGRRHAVGRHTPNNSLTGNGLQDFRLLDRDYASIYTKPDTTDNRSTLLNVSARRQLQRRGCRCSRTPTTATSAPTRSTATSTKSRSTRRSISRARPNGRRSRPPATARFPPAALDASNTPFPSLRCIGNALLNDEPSEKCNGLINQTRHDSAQRRRRPARSRIAGAIGAARERLHRRRAASIAARSASRSRPSSAI